MSATQLAACLQGGREGEGWGEMTQQISQTHLPSHSRQSLQVVLAASAHKTGRYGF